MAACSILFIGNSYTGRNNLPGLIATAAKPRLEIATGAILANGMSLKYHWDHGQALAALAQKPWDWVVLQEQSTLPLKNRAKMHEHVEKFDAEIKCRGGRTALYLNWPRQNALERQDELNEAFTSIGHKLGATVVPVGPAWQRAGLEHPQIKLYESDGSHPTLAGSYLAACVFLATLFGKEHLPADAGTKLPPATVVLLREVARAT